MSDSNPTDLQQLQALLYRLIVAPNGVEDALAREAGAIDLRQIIVGDERITAAGHAGIYADAYFYRLLDALKEDFPATLAVAGADEFHNLITGYLLAHPPTQPSLLYAGRYLADYLGKSSMLARWPFIADLAQLERALIESFHAADAPALDREAVQSIPPDDWPAIALRLHPATRLLRLQWRVQEILCAVEQNFEPPKATAAPVMMMVWRKQAQVSYRPVEPPEAIALELIERGCDFASLCEVVGSAAKDSDIPRLINLMLTRWLDDGVLLNQAVT
jgi:Putative DNA-binding domain